VCCWCVIPKGLNELSQFLLAFLMCFDAVVGRQEGHLACKKLSGRVLAWLYVWSEMQTCIWPRWCHCHSLSLASVKSRLVLPFWYRPAQVDLDKGLLNGGVCVCVCVCVRACARVCVCVCVCILMCNMWGSLVMLTVYFFCIQKNIFTLFSIIVLNITWTHSALLFHPS